MLKPLAMWITINCGRFLKKQEYLTTLPASWETYTQVKKQQLELNVERWTGSQLGKKYKAVYCYSAYLLYMQSTSSEMPGCESQAGIKTARRNINNLRYADDASLMAESEEELKSLLMKVKEEIEKAGLKLNIKKTKIMASSLITSWQIEGKQWKQWHFIFLGSKITADGDCSEEIKRCLFLWWKAMTNIGRVVKAETLLYQQRSV